MTTSESRRQFIRATIAGSAAVAGLAGRGAYAATSAAVDSADQGRRALVDQAHFGRKSLATSRDGMAICTHPIASHEAVEILREGGNACDAALAASVVQSVVEPHMTSITGVLSMLYFDAATGQTTYVNGSANAPQAELPGFSAADLRTGRGVAVPGFWAGFEAAHARHGHADRRRVISPAVHYARHGFETYPFLWGMIFSQAHLIGLTSQGREIYLPDTALPRPGDMLYQRRAADTLEALIEGGNDYFYRGEFARELVDTVRAAGGVLTMEDMAAYDVRWQAPAWGTYRGYRIAASPPPDHGGSHMIEILNMIELLDLQRLGPPTESAETLYQMMRIVDRVYRDGAQQQDPRSHYLPVDVLLSKEYAAMRFELLQMDTTLPADGSAVSPGSNHVTVADRAGNVATILHSCMSYPWSNGLFAGGVSIVAAGAHFLRVMPAPGDRISAYVCPNIVFSGDRPVLASGSPSVGLLANIAQNIVNVLDFGLEIDESVHRPRFGGVSAAVPGGIMVEVDIDERLRDAVVRRGVKLEVVNPWNWSHGSFDGIRIEDGVYKACGDPRRTAVAVGV
ncbi:MAG: gamma-glutamyltransferase [Gammaproteobacteria bacterium]|nr:gamma-glutamyltransferase [Gammaproteobacteria bacterium]